VATWSPIKRLYFELSEIFRYGIARAFPAGAPRGHGEFVHAHLLGQPLPVPAEGGLDPVQGRLDLPALPADPAQEAERLRVEGPRVLLPRNPLVELAAGVVISQYHIDTTILLKINPFLSSGMNSVPLAIILLQVG